jgi:hypothetical protein
MIICSSIFVLVLFHGDKNHIILSLESITVVIYPEICQYQKYIKSEIAYDKIKECCERGVSRTSHWVKNIIAVFQV